jgi:hypothetical protein
MHSPALLVLCLLALAPTVGYAQPAGAPTASPELQEPSPPPPPPKAEIIPRQLDTEDKGAGYRGPRLILGTLAGGVASAIGGVIGLIAGGVLGDCSLLSSDCAFAFVFSTALGSSLAASLAAYGVGSALEGRGKFMPTLLGGILGSAAGMAVLLASGGGAWPASLAIAGLGAAIGYEISHAVEPPVPVKDPFASAGPRVMPVVGMTREGGILGGLVGRF